VHTVTVCGPLCAGRAAPGGALLGSLRQGLALASAGPDGPSVDWGLVRATLLSVVYAAFLIAVVCLLVWALGLLRRSRPAHTETPSERALRLEIDRDQQAQIATSAERTRITRQMQDVMAHSQSVVIALS